MSKKTAGVDEKDVMKALEPFSKALGKAASQVWKIFVMRYVAKGAAEVFLAIFIVWTSFYFLGADDRLWQIPFFLAAGLFIYDAIQLLVDPHYFAMNDVALRLKSENIFKRN